MVAPVSVTVPRPFCVRLPVPAAKVLPTVTASVRLKISTPPASIVIAPDPSAPLALLLPTCTFVVPVAAVARPIRVVPVLVLVLLTM